MATLKCVLGSLASKYVAGALPAQSVCVSKRSAQVLREGEEKDLNCFAFVLNTAVTVVASD